MARTQFRAANTQSRVAPAADSDEDIGLCQHALNEGEIGGSSSNRPGRISAAIDPYEIGRLAEDAVVIAPRKIAFRPLELDDAGAGIGKPYCRHGARHRLFQRDDHYAFKCTSHALYRWFRGGKLELIGPRKSMRFAPALHA